MKALIEGMLFTSDRPVTIRQITARVRSVIKRRSTDFVPSADISGDGVSPSAESVAIAGATANAANDDVAHAESAPEPGASTPASTDGAVRTDRDAAPVPENAAATSIATDAAEQILRRARELNTDLSLEDIRKRLLEIEEDLRRDDRGIELIRVAKGYQLRTKADVAAFLTDDKRPVSWRLSPSALETLAIITYEQPVNRQRLEDVRGVDSGGVLKTLLDRDLVRLIGRSDEPGRPLVYGTTGRFLEVFGLDSLKELPAPKDFREWGEEVSVPETAGIEPQSDDGDEGEYIRSTDFADADISSFAEDERAVLEELDESLGAVREAEKALDFGDERDVPESLDSASIPTAPVAPDQSA